MDEDVPHHHDGSPAEHGHEHFGPADAAAMATREGARATWISLGILAGTAALQVAIFLASGSVALLADTIHNATDALTAIPLLIAFRLGRRPPSRRFPYGYHRAEDIAGLVIVALIFVSAVLAAWEAISRLREPQTVTDVGWVFAAGAIGVAGNQLVSAYRIRVGAVEADRRGHRRDDDRERGQRVGPRVEAVGDERLRSDPAPDAVIGLVIVGAIVVTLVQAARSVLHRALDGTEESTITLIETVAASVVGVEHVTDARARWSGHRLLAELAIDVDGGLRVEEGHAIAERVRRALLHDVPRLAEATVHVDPHEHAPHTV